VAILLVFVHITADTFPQWAIPLLKARVSAVVKEANTTKTASSDNGIADVNDDDEMPEYLEHYHLHNDRDYYEHIRTLHEEAGITAGPADAPDILEDLLHLQATKEEWNPVWTIGMAMTNFGAGECRVALDSIVLIMP